MPEYNTEELPVAPPSDDRNTPIRISGGGLVGEGESPQHQGAQGLNLMFFCYFAAAATFFSSARSPSIAFQSVTSSTSGVRET